MSSAIPYFTADEIGTLLTLDRATAALEIALRDEPGIDPEQDTPRSTSPAPDGEFLLMPSQGPRFSGLKALTVAPNNPARGLKKIQGVYILNDSDTLAPVAIMEGSSLTAIRTPAVTVCAVRALSNCAPPDEELPEIPSIHVFGASVQALSHIRALALAFPRAIFTVSGRRPERVAALLQDLQVSVETRERQIRAIAASEIAETIRAADIIVCTTSSHTPVFDGSLVKPGAIVAGVGAHGLEMQEIDDALVARSDLFVESRVAARRESGNLSSLTASTWESPNSRPANLRELCRGEVVRTPGKPALYTGVGMSWEDLVCAAEVFTASGASK